MPADSRIATHFATLPDPRLDRCKRHDLLDIVTIAVCAVICGADTWADVERFGHAKLPWFRTFLPLPNSIPSHDTFGCVFAALDPVAFETAFLGWVQALVPATNGTVVAIDGKTARRSHDRSHDRGPLHLVSAWATANHVALGQVATDDDSNEITAIPALLDALTLDGAVVTINAIGCQPEIAGQIIDGDADDVLALKANQPSLHELVAHHFALTDTAVDHRTVEKDHGRLEIRTGRATEDPAVLAWLDPDGRWPGLQRIAAVTGERHVGETVTQETRYYLSRLPGDPERIGQAVRAHWGIENGLHWVLDVAFREDESLVRSGHAAESLALLRKLALTLLTRETTAKAGITGKRLMCGWDETYLAKVLTA